MVRAQCLTSSLKAIDLALPDILLCKMSGARQVGLFSRANSTVNILNHVAGPTINYVALPYLAKVHHGGHDMAAELKRVIAYITGIFWPALAVIAVLAEPIVVLLYGDAWRESARVMVWLCVGLCRANHLQPGPTRPDRHRPPLPERHRADFCRNPQDQLRHCPLRWQSGLLWGRHRHCRPAHHASLCLSAANLSRPQPWRYPGIPDEDSSRCHCRTMRSASLPWSCCRQPGIQPLSLL